MKLNKGQTVILYTPTEPIGTFQASRVTVAVAHDDGSARLSNGNTIDPPALPNRGHEAVFVSPDMTDAEAVKHGKKLAKQWLKAERDRWAGVKARANSKAGATYASEQIKALTGIKPACVID